jgi:hypothetical protein
MSVLSRIVDELNDEPFQSRSDLAKKLGVPDDAAFKQAIDDAVKGKQIIPLVPKDPNTTYHSNAFNVTVK